MVPLSYSNQFNKDARTSNFFLRTSELIYIFRVSAGERLPIEDSSVDLLTVCQAIHWFDLTQFYSEVDRVLKPNGVLVLIGYHLTGVNNQPEINQLRDEIYENLKLKKYFNPKIAILDDAYKSLSVPYQNSLRVEKDCIFMSTLKNFIKEIPSWSGFQAFQKSEGTESAQQVLQNLTEKSLEILNSNDENMEVELKVPYFAIVVIKP